MEVWPRIFKNIHIVLALVFMIGIFAQRNKPDKQSFDPDTDGMIADSGIATRIVSGSVIEISAYSRVIW